LQFRRLRRFCRRPLAYIKRKNYLKLEKPSWDLGSNDTRLAEATENISGLAQAQIQLKGSVKLDVYDPVSNSLVPGVVSTNDVVIGAEIRNEDLHDLFSVASSGMLDEATRQSEIQDTLLSAFKCSGTVSIQIKEQVETFSCQSLIKKAVIEAAQTIQNDDD